MKKRKLVIIMFLSALLIGACAGSGKFGKRHRSKRKCNCPTFSFYHQKPLMHETPCRTPSRTIA